MELDWTLLENGQRLQREKGARDAAKLLAAGDMTATQTVQEHMIALLTHDTWEGRHGGLLLLQEYLLWQEHSKQAPTDCSQWVDSCLKLLIDKEVRVRATSGELVALLCRLGGTELYDSNVAGPLLSSIESNMTLERDGQAFLDDDEATKRLAAKLLAGEVANDQRKKGYGNKASRASSIQSTIFHDTAGWGPLETDVTCLQQIIEKCGAQFASRLGAQSEVVELLCTAALHMNRFVRGTAFRAINGVVRSLDEADLRDAAVEHMAGEPRSQAKLLDSMAQSGDLVARLGSGLCDEWANVRMEASVALRTFLVALQTPERRECYYNELLPRMCLNRYHVAAGVANYSLETWKMTLHDKGKETVVRWLPSIVPFYVMQTRLANSEARIAAARCIGELAARVDRVAVSTYAQDLMEAVIRRLNQADAWEVKAAACNSVKDLIEAFPDRFNLSANLPQLLPSLSALLADTVWSVREVAAVTLGALAKVSEETDVAPILELCLDGLTAASKEADEREKYGKSELVDLKRERNNDVSLHSNQDTIDCCAVGDLDLDDSEQLSKLSLSAMYNQAVRHKIELRLDKWERTDGCLYLVREMAANGLWEPRLGAEKPKLCLENVFPIMAQVATLRHFLKHLTVLTTLWNVLPCIAQTIGADSFKEHLAAFVDSLAYSLRSEDDLTVAAAQTCISELARFLGHETFSDCVQRHDAASLDVFSACLVQA